LIEVTTGITTCLRPCVKCIPKGLAYLQQRSIFNALVRQFGQAIGNNRSHKSGRMCHKMCEVLSISGGWWFGIGQLLEQLQELR